MLPGELPAAIETPAYPIKSGLLQCLASTHGRAFADQWISLHEISLVMVRRSNFEAQLRSVGVVLASATVCA